MEYTENADEGKELVFLFNLADGVCTQSFGLKCAQIAQMPEWIISRAKYIGGCFRGENVGNAECEMIKSMQELDRVLETDELEEELKKVNPDDLESVKAFIRWMEIRDQR